jgi:signal transduction histidine kinase
VVKPWRQWSERTRGAILVTSVFGVGMFAEARSSGYARAIAWLPDLGVGVSLALVGVALRMRDAGRVGSLIVLAGTAWFAGNFAGEATTWISWSAGHLSLLHRAILFFVVATFPLGRVRDHVERTVIVAAFAGVLVVDVARDAWWMIVWATGLFVLYLLLVRRRTGLPRAAGFQVLPVMAVFSATLVCVAAMMLALGTSPPPQVTVYVYEAGIVVTAVFLWMRQTAWRGQAVQVADAVVELTFGPSGNVRDLLSTALRDSGVDVVFAINGDHTVSWVDEVGRPAEPLSACGRAVVPIRVDGLTVAEVASNVDLEGFPGLLDGVESATRLAAAHARLRSELRSEADLLAASRLRLLSAADGQRAALAVQLEREAGQTLAQIRDLLDGIAPDICQEIDEAAHRSIGRLEGLESDFHSLAAGLGPVALSRGGLGVALQHLADDGNVEVELTCSGPVDGLSSTTATTLYFACAEGIANAVKHSMARRVEVALEVTTGFCTLNVADDGCGGTDISAGSGLRSLADRVGALGGQLRLDSPVGAGTRLTVELPAR